MNQIQLQTIKNKIFNSTLICLGIYFFIAFLPLPYPINIDIDSCWQYAISQAVENGLIFGKDIIFTYGPLGYLTDGAPLEANFFLITAFRLIVYLALYIIAVIKILKTKSKSQKILLTFSLLISFLFWLSTDYQILFIFILILSFGELLKKSIYFWSLVLGAFAGFCLLTKFTLGIGTFSSLILFLLGNLYTSIKSKSNITISIFVLINSLLAAISISFILLSPSYFILSLTKIIICLALSTLVGAVFYVTQQQKNSQKTKDNEYQIPTKKILVNRFRVKIFSWWIFYFVYSVCLTWVIVYSYPSLLEYIANSLEISSGYSSAMSELGPHPVVWVAISKVLLISCLITLIIKEGNIGFGLALFFVLYLGFKHGHVRQDFHIFIFVSLALFLVVICLNKLRTNHFKKWAHFVTFYVLTISLLYLNLPPTIFFNEVQVYNPISSLHTSNIEDVQDYNPISPLHLGSIITQLTSLFNFSSFKAKVLAENNANIALFNLPGNIRNFLKDSSIDIIPWEIPIVSANQLNWEPRPIFQSYSAYTTKLDKINFESLSKKPRDYIIYRFDAIDKRHPFFDEPKTFAYIFCNYHPSNKFPNFISPTNRKMKGYKYLLLEKVSSSQCWPNLGDSDLSVSWGKTIPINLGQDKSLIIAHVQLKYSILGKLYKILYRIAPVIMQVKYQDKTEAQYRILPESSQNIIVSHLPRSNEEVLAFFQGELPALVESFSFNVNPSWLFKPTIEIKFSSVLLKKD